MKLDFGKYIDRLIPAIVQDARTLRVLMLGFMSEESLNSTRETGRVTFFSRSRQKLWIKGETSGNFLNLISIDADCDGDTLLIRVRPNGPVCHTGAETCFEGDHKSHIGVSDLLNELEATIDSRRSCGNENSYVARLFDSGINKIAQKVGEEAVEMIIEAKDDDAARFKSEAADLLFHYIILLRAKDISLNEIVSVLRERRQ